MPESWMYEVRDNGSDRLLFSHGKFETEADARLQAQMEINADNVKGCYIKTLPGNKGGK